MNNLVNLVHSKPSMTMKYFDRLTNYSTVGLGVFQALSEDDTDMGSKLKNNLLHTPFNIIINFGGSEIMAGFSIYEVVFRIAYGMLALVACLFVSDKKEFFNTHVVEHGFKGAAISSAVFGLCILNMITLGGLSHLIYKAKNNPEETQSLLQGQATKA